ncbi:PilN domain-containing protein [Halanaerobaculum tunisiense]
MIELLPEEITDQRRKRKVISYSSLVVVIILGITWGINFYCQQLIADYELQLKQIKQEQKSLVAKKKKLKSKVSKIKRYQNLQQVTNDISYSRVVKDLKLVIPQQVWLTKFIIEQDKLLVSGLGTTNRQVIKTLERVNLYPYFQEVDLSSNSYQEQKVDFQLTGRLAYEPD